MNDDIISRLQFIADNTTTVIPEEIEEVCDAAVKEIEALKQENERILVENELKIDKYRKLARKIFYAEIKP